ncbi:MAG: SoxY-related AACIE arm protein [Casimicrobiaceae bacterium]
MPAHTHLSSHARRRWLVGSGGLTLLLLLRPAASAPTELQGAIDAFTGGARVLPGKVTLDIATLVENGNGVPISVAVDSPMTAADHVAAIAIFSERNPEHDVARFRLGPRAGRARVATRIRLATSQRLVAVAQLNYGTYWSGSADVVVTLAACIEGES